MYLYTGSKAAIICENKQGTINCPDGGSLNILSASYGRSSPDTCPHPRPATMTKTDCDSPNDILSIVKEHCKSQSSTSVCKIKPSNGLFRGDPCVGTYKYLTVEFECKDPGELKRLDIYTGVASAELFYAHSGKILRKQKKPRRFQYRDYT